MENKAIEEKAVDFAIYSFAKGIESTLKNVERLIKDRIAELKEQERYYKNPSIVELTDLLTQIENLKK